MPLKIKRNLLCFCLAFSSFTMTQASQVLKTSKNSKKSEVISKKDKYSAYLFVYFTGNRKDEEQIRFALSDDGYNFRALNQDKPVISSAKISSTGGVRDPHILRGADGKTFYMVATDMVSALGWNSNRAMILLKSTNLTN